MKAKEGRNEQTGRAAQDGRDQGNDHAAGEGAQHVLRIGWKGRLVVIQKDKEGDWKCDHHSRSADEDRNGRAAGPACRLRIGAVGERHG